MKKMKYLMWFLIVPLLAGMILTDCKKDDDDPPPPAAVDFTVLDARIVEAQDLHDAAVEGTAIGDYEVGSRLALQTAIDAATTIRNTAGVTQSQVDATIVNLQAAIDEFESKKITDVSPENLVAHWLFNGSAADVTGNGNDGTLEAGHVDYGGGPAPQPTADRFGNADFCYHFDQGCNVEVPQPP
jgi:hypothetical protein